MAWLIRDDRLLISIRNSFFSGSPFGQNSKVKRAQLGVVSGWVRRYKLVSEPTLAVTRMVADRCVVMLFMTFVTRRGTRYGTCTGLEAQTYVPRGNVPVARRGRRFL